MINQLVFDLFSFIGARVSSELSGEADDHIAKFLEPVLANFDEQKWAKPAWIKFIMIIVVCNGGNGNVM